MKKPNNLHPEVFTEVWRKWSVLCATYELSGKTLTKKVETNLWNTAYRIMDIAMRADWEAFRHKYGIGVYR